VLYYHSRNTNHCTNKQPVRFGWWPMTGAALFREKSTAGWLLVADLF
jgi:hypothetical protein